LKHSDRDQKYNITITYKESTLLKTHLLIADPTDIGGPLLLGILYEYIGKI